MMRKVASLYRSFGPRHGSFELLHKVAGYRRYTRPLQPARTTLERLLMNRVVRRTRAGFDPREQLFRAVHIQTRTECNYSCAFCPNSSLDRAVEEMELGLYRRILADLRRLGFDGWIHLYLMAEPLTDPRIVELAALAAEACPTARIQLQTNGSLLTRELYDELMAVPQVHFTVNDYTAGHRVLRRVAPFIGSGEQRQRTLLVPRRRDEVMTNRAGNGQPSRFRLPLPLFCTRPFDYLCVAHDGRCPLCCCDWRLQAVTGDAAAEPLDRIWAGPVLAGVRGRLMRSDRRTAICGRCDFLGYQRTDGRDGLDVALARREGTA
jgi:MoaA/NifB/PqqE/SkfB family radical SAM enzyme